MLPGDDLQRCQLLELSIICLPLHYLPSVKNKIPLTLPMYILTFIVKDLLYLKSVLLRYLGNGLIEQLNTNIVHVTLLKLETILEKLFFKCGYQYSINYKLMQEFGNYKKSRHSFVRRKSYKKFLKILFSALHKVRICNQEIQESDWIQPILLQRHV